MADQASYVFAAVFFLIGLGVLSAGTVFIVFGLSSYHWDIVEGTVTRSIGHPTTEHSGEIGQVEIGYRYLVNGEQYDGSRVSFYLNLPVSKEQLLEDYAVGNMVAEFYNPALPKLAVLLPGVSSGNYILPGVGFAFMLSGAFLWRWERRGQRKEESRDREIDRARRESPPPAPSSVRSRYAQDFSYPVHIINRAAAVFVVFLSLFLIFFFIHRRFHPPSVSSTVGFIHRRFHLPSVSSTGRTRCCLSCGSRLWCFLLSARG